MDFSVSNPHSYKVILEYVWIDGFNNLRSKSRIIDLDSSNFHIPIWNCDGSSTGQATEFNSDLMLNPVRVCPDPFAQSIPWCENYLVLCETLDQWGNPHSTNFRQRCMAIEEESLSFEPLFGV